MMLEVTIGCAACGFSNKLHVNSFFDCDSLVCPGCGNENCLSITSVTEEATSRFKKQNILQRLERIREL